MKKTLLALLMTSALAFPVSAMAATENLRESALELFKPLPSTIPALKDNKITDEKIELGKKLFFDPRLSASGVFSCNSCHNLATGGADNLETSIGHGWQRGPRNSPIVFNSVLNEAQFWDGRASDLKEQAKGPIQASVEMANTPENVVKTLKSIPAYVKEFQESFPKEKDPVTFDNMARAIEAYEATLLTPSPFDAWLNGNDDALTAEQKKGLALFIDKGCTACHNGVNVGGNGYYPFGLIEKPGAEILPADDKGRFAVTETADDEYVFRAAPLRNVALTAPYFHSGKVWSLETAVAIMAESQLGEKLNDQEVKDIVAFLHSLTGKAPTTTIPVLPASTAATPRPTAEVIKQ